MSTHDKPTNCVGPIQPFGGLGSVEAGLGGPLVTKDVEKAKVPQGVHGGGRVGLMLGVGHGCWGAEGAGEGEYKGSSWELMGAEGKVGGVPAKRRGGPPPPPPGRDSVAEKS